MYIELLDTLRCVEDHPQIPLVTAISDRDGRFVVNAVMGCPTCRREYPVHNGVALFATTGDAVQGGHTVTTAEESALRIAAFLQLSEGGSIALTGSWASESAAVAALVAVRVFAVNPAVRIDESERVGIVTAGKRLPFAERSLRGIALGESGWSEMDVDAAARVLAPSGRMVLPVSVPLPDALQEVARDDVIRIAEKRGPLVALHRR